MFKGTKKILYDYNFKPNQPIDYNILDSFGIWGNKLKLLTQKVDFITPNSKRPNMVLPKYGVINKKSYIIGTRSHGGDGGNAMSRRCRRHKEQRRSSVQIIDNSFGINVLYINC